MNNGRLKIMLSVLPLMLLMVSCGAEDPGETDTPQYEVQPIPQISAPAADEIHTADEGVAVIAAGETGEASASPVSETPDVIWDNDRTVSYHGYTMPEKAQLRDDGCIGVLSAPAIGLNVCVYEANDMMSTMLKGAAHFKSTSAWDGNVGISAHNGGVDPDISFGRVNELVKGDAISYLSALGERSYTVFEIKEIADDDWSYLGRTADNRITLITCIEGKPDKRLMVQAVDF